MTPYKVVVNYMINIILDYTSVKNSVFGSH